MAIDRSGKWWTGDDHEDLAEYLTVLTKDGFPADAIAQSRCRRCDGTEFTLRARRREGAARRSCAKCGTDRFIANSEETWGKATGHECRCPCGDSVFNIAVAFSLR
ncbi:MAG TPA: hypothetical protein VIW46_09205, partial [Acidimicrobiia bacterium]